MGHAQGENSEISRKPFIILFAFLIKNIICIMKLVKPGYFCCNMHLWQQGHLLQQKKNSVDRCILILSRLVQALASSNLHEMNWTSTGTGISKTVLQK